MNNLIDMTRARITHSNSGQHSQIIIQMTDQRVVVLDFPNPGSLMRLVNVIESLENALFEDALRTDEPNSIGASKN